MSRFFDCVAEHCLISAVRVSLPSDAANFNQGWPKFAHNLIFTTADGGAAVGIFAPATAKLPKTAASAYESATVDMNTTYPFGDTVTITVTMVGFMTVVGLVTF